MKPNAFPLVIQGLALVSAVALAVLGPQPGRASLLVPISAASADQAARLSARWATEENAQLIAFDAQQGRATVVAGDAFSLMRALSYGLVPIASDIPSCTAAPDGQNSESTSV